MSFKRASPGQPLDTAITAADWNRVRQAAEDYYAGAGKTNPPKPGSPTEHDLVWVENASGSDVDQWGVLGLDSPVWPPETPQDLAEGLGNPIPLKGVAPEEKHTGRFAVATEPIRAGQVGRAVVSGVTVAMVQIGSPEHRFADVSPGQAALVSAMQGAAEILWADDGEDGPQLAVVRIGPDVPELVQFRLIEERSDDLLCQHGDDEENEVAVLKPPQMRGGVGKIGDRWIDPPYCEGDEILAARQEPGKSQEDGQPIYVDVHHRQFNDCPVCCKGEPCGTLYVACDPGADCPGSVVLYDEDANVVALRFGSGPPCCYASSGPTTDWPTCPEPEVVGVFSDCAECDPDKCATLTHCHDNSELVVLWVEVEQYAGKIVKLGSDDCWAVPSGPDEDCTQEPVSVAVSEHFDNCEECEPECATLVDCDDPDHTLKVLWDEVSVYAGLIVKWVGDATCWSVPSGPDLPGDCNPDDLDQITPIADETFGDCEECEKPTATLDPCSNEDDPIITWWDEVKDHAGKVIHLGGGNCGRCYNVPSEPDEDDDPDNAVSVIVRDVYDSCGECDQYHWVTPCVPGGGAGVAVSWVVRGPLDKYVGRIIKAGGLCLTVIGPADADPDAPCLDPAEVYDDCDDCWGVDCSGCVLVGAMESGEAPEGLCDAAEDEVRSKANEACDGEENVDWCACPDVLANGQTDAGEYWCIAVGCYRCFCGKPEDRLRVLGGHGAGSDAEPVHIEKEVDAEDDCNDHVPSWMDCDCGDCVVLEGGVYAAPGDLDLRVAKVGGDCGCPDPQENEKGPYTMGPYVEDIEDIACDGDDITLDFEEACNCVYVKVKEVKDCFIYLVENICHHRQKKCRDDGSCHEEAT